MDSEARFHIRQMQPADSDGIAALMQEDKASLTTTHFVLDSYTVLTNADHHDTVGMVAVETETNTLAGLATVSLGQVQFEGQVLPYASLDSWQVGKAFRQQGLASRLVQATIDYAEAKHGPDVVLRSGLVSSNDASRATASKWAREFYEPLSGTIAPIKKRSPAEMSGVTVREALPGDYADIVVKQNEFFAQYNLYEPLSVESLTRILQYAPGETDAPMYHYWIAETAGGEILAGALLRRRGLLMVDTLNMHNMPLALRLANLIVRMVPPDNTLREIGLDAFWFAAGQIAVAKHLWQMLPWALRDKGTTVMAGYDPRSPLAQVFEPIPRLQRNFQIANAIRGPVPTNSDRYTAVGSRR